MTIELDEGALTKRNAGAGPALYWASAMPKDSPKAILAMIHGYADHGARYAHVRGALAEHGIGSIMIDLRGHGRAAGSRGFCNRWSEFLDDARELKALAVERAKNAPLFLFGHSFGGLVAASSVLDGGAHPYKGLVLSAPFFGLGLEVPALKLAAGKIASRLVPKLGLPSGLHGADLTHDAEKAKAYDDDPLVFPNATARWFTEATAAQQRCLEGASRLSLPLYIVFGTDDKVASFPTGKKFFDAAGSSDKTWDPKTGLFHEVLNEPSWKETVDAIAKWTLAHAL